MSFCPVSGVFVEAVTWVLFFEFVHVPVTKNLGQDRGCRDARDATVALDDGHLDFGRDAVDFEVAVDGDEQ